MQEMQQYPVLNLMRIKLIVLVFLFAAKAADSQSLQDSVIPGEKLIEDLHHLRSKIDEIHPSPYIYCTRVQLDTAFAMAEREVADGQTYYAFAGTVGKTLRTLRDSHTTLNFPALIGLYLREGGLLLDFGIRSIDDKLYISDDGQFLLPRGAELISINDYSAKEVHRRIGDFSIYEGHSITAFRRINDVLFRRFCAVFSDVKRENIIKLIRPGERDTLSIVYPGNTWKTLRKQHKKHDKEQVYDLEINKGGRYAILRIGSFSYKGQGRFDRFLKRSFRKIRRHDVDWLAIDLRDNTGGKSNRMERLFAYIDRVHERPVPANVIGRQSHDSEERYRQTFKRWNRWVLRNFRGKDEDVINYLRLTELPVGAQDTVYFKEPEPVNEKLTYDRQCALFVNGLTGSASVNFAGMFKLTERGPIIGEACLGPISGTWGNAVMLKLKESGLPVLVASIRFNNLNNFEYPQTPVLPDVPVSPTPQDLKDYTDVCRKAFLEMVGH